MEIPMDNSPHAQVIEAAQRLADTGHFERVYIRAHVKDSNLTLETEVATAGDDAAK